MPRFALSRSAGSQGGRSVALPKAPLMASLKAVLTGLRIDIKASEADEAPAPTG